MDWNKAASLALPFAATFRVTGRPPEAGIVFMRADNTPNITIRPTGEVKLAPGLEISEASRLFWQGLADAFPAWRAEVIPAAAVPAANVTPMRQPRTDLARLVESIKAAVYANGDGLSVTEAIGALELAKLELLKEQEQ